MHGYSVTGSFFQTACDSLFGWFVGYIIGAVELSILNLKKINANNTATINSNVGT